MKKTLLTVCTALLLGFGWPAMGEPDGALFRCGMHLGGKGMTYQPSLGWKKIEPERRSRSVLLADPPRDMTLPVASQEFRHLRDLRGDLRAPRPLALAKAGCTWR